MAFKIPSQLQEASDWYRSWLTEAALPLWCGAGMDRSRGAFHEAIDHQGRPIAANRRARTQARQVFVFSVAAAAALNGPWLAVAQRGFQYYSAHYSRPDGRFAILADPDGRIVDDTPALYEQAFTLLAMAKLQVADQTTDLSADASALRASLDVDRHDAGGFKEHGPYPFQANAHMHLLECCLAWEDVGAAGWNVLADEIVHLALTRFIDGETGVLREFFDAAWNPAPGDDGRLIEPGHHFEWAWLLQRWGARRGDPKAQIAARSLFALGLRGVDHGRDVAVNALWDDLRLRDPSARLWPQTEYLKAALLLGDDKAALQATRGLRRYLETPIRGLWFDKLREDGSFIAEPAPATSFYHIVGALQELGAVSA